MNYCLSRSPQTNIETTTNIRIMFSYMVKFSEKNQQNFWVIQIMIKDFFYSFSFYWDCCWLLFLYLLSVVLFFWFNFQNVNDFSAYDKEDQEMYFNNMCFFYSQLPTCQNTQCQCVLKQKQKKYHIRLQKTSHHLICFFSCCYFFV